METQINEIDDILEGLLRTDPVLIRRYQTLQEIEGRCSIVATTLSRLAPRPLESGKTLGYRRIRRGRADDKRSLFMFTMTARRSHCSLKNLYENVIKRDKMKISFRLLLCVKSPSSLLMINLNLYTHS